MTKVNFNVLLTDAAIVAAIGLNHKQYDTAQMNTHRILVAIAAKWKACGDVRPAVTQVNLLLDTMPLGVRANSIRAWVETLLLLTFCDEGENKGKFVSEKAKADNLDMKLIEETRWFSLIPPTPYKALDFAADLGKLLKRGAERVNSSKGDTVDPELLQAISNAVAQHNEAKATEASKGRVMPVEAE